MGTLLYRWLMWVALALLLAGHLLAGGTGSSLALADEKAKAPAKDADASQPADPAAKAAPPPKPILLRRGAVAIPSGGKVAVIPISGTIYEFTVESLKRRVERAIAANVDVIVFELNTNGGLAESALQISKYIRGQVERKDRTKVPTIAWVNDKAYSAGILIASACNHIIMSPAAAAGDCAPIVPGMALPDTERMKALSPLLAEFRSSADDNNQPFAVFHAMCELGIRLYLIEHKSEKDPLTGEPMRKIVNQADYQIMVEGKARGKEDTNANGAEMVKLGTPRRDVATDADRAQWKLIEEVHDGSTLLTLSTKQAVRYGIALGGTFANDSDIEKFLAASVVHRVDETWSETMAGWLVSMPVRAVLIVVFLVCGVIEMMAPGISAPGIIAAVALIILIVSPLLVGLAEVWHLILFFIGFLMLMVEVFVTPGFGVLGIGGIIAMVAGLILAVVPTGGGGPVPLPAPEMMATLQQSILWTFIGVIGGAIGFFVLVKYYGQMPILNRMVLQTSQRAVVGATPGLPPAGNSGPANQREEDGSEESARDNPRIVAARQTIAGDETMGGGVRVGDVGRTTGELRPMGKAQFAGRVIDVQSVGTWVDAARPVRVVKMIGSRVIVEEA
jgi:membrane-bound serine protease (ClpP class)